MNPEFSQLAQPDLVWPQGGGMGERIRAFEWTRHPLGPPEGWPEILKITLRTMLSSRFAMWLAWGPEMYFFYNDAYAPSLGIKEPWALGTPLPKLWTEVWDLMGPRAESVLRTGKPTWDESLRLFLERRGYAEESYHTFSCSPVYNEDGGVGGILSVVTEETERVIDERRLALLHELGVDLARTDTEGALLRALQARLAARDHDLPFALVYLFDDRGANATLACSHGVKENPELAPPQVLAHAATQAWPASAMLQRSGPVIINDLASRFREIPPGPWDKPARQAIVVPIAPHGTGAPAGFLVAGINPYRPLDAAYTGFIELLAGQIAAGIANVRAHEGERQRAESLAQIDRARTAFFDSISHELRAPLTLILGPAEELLKSTVASTVPPELRDRAAVIHRNALRMLKAVNTLLDFSRIEANRLQPAFEPVDLSQLTAEVASAFRSAIEQAGLRFTVDCPPLGEPVFVDRDMWEKIVLNLLSNAFKFTLTGEISVSLRIGTKGVEFSVTDTGAGIPPEARPHLYERFFHVPGNQGRTREGMGIGLALVHELVRLHGGDIEVESTPGRGACFTILLKRGSAHLPVNGPAAEERSGPSHAETFVAEANQWNATDEWTQTFTEEDLPAGDTGARVLIVDDNADLRRYVARLLSSRFHVLTAADGETALEVVQKERPHLVLTDVMMPKLDGFGLLRAIRSREDLRTIPVILLSARAGEESRIAALDAGADDFLVKPFSGRELLARVSAHVQLARVRGEAAERERDLRTRAEVFASALRESTERLSASLAAAGTGTFRWDLKSNAFDYDESLDRLLGIVPSRQPRPLTEFLNQVHPADRDWVRVSLTRSAREGTNFDLEYRIVRPDGAIRWVQNKAETFLDERGRPAYLTGACVDITKRKQAETFVWRQRDVLEQIVQGAPLADVLETLTLDVEQVAERPMYATVLMVNPTGDALVFAAGRRCPGWSQARPIPIGPNESSCGTAAFRKERIIVPDVMTSPLWEKHRLECVRHGLRACWATPILSSSGAVLGTVAVLYPEPGAPTEDEIRFVDTVARTAAIAVERERYEVALKESQAQLASHAQQLEERVRERTAELQETVSELESFSYSISHDMRAPLRAMQSFAQILAEECGHQISPEGKDYLRRIIGASDRMDRLIQDVLTYSRVSRTELQLGPVDAEALIDGLLETYPHFQARRARIEVRRPLPRVVANEAGLVQCLSNLIGNAVKFVAPNVTPHVEIWGETIGSRVRLYVRDNGIGIAPEAHEKIFHIFYQLDRRYEGTGIGLAVVRKAAERMGGSVGLKSEVNRGSTFHLEFAAADNS